MIEPAGRPHTGTVVFMHGLGDNAFGWSDTCAGAFAARLPHVKFIVPTAAERPVTINGGMEMPAWVRGPRPAGARARWSAHARSGAQYDITSLSADARSSPDSCAGIDESREILMKLIADERAMGIAASRIVLGGT